MAPSDDDADPKSLLPKLSRRAFFKGAGASALTATLAQSAAEAAAAASPAVVGPEPAPLSLNVNGRAVTVQADPATTLAEVLRHNLGMTGTKVGCDRGACSACTVWLDGEVAASCMTLATRVLDEELARQAAKAAVSGATPLSKNAYKVPMLEAVIRRTVLAAAAAA